MERVIFVLDAILRETMAVPFTFSYEKEQTRTDVEVITERFGLFEIEVRSRLLYLSLKVFSEDTFIAIESKWRISISARLRLVSQFAT